MKRPRADVWLVKPTARLLARLSLAEALRWSATTCVAYRAERECVNNLFYIADANAHAYNILTYVVHRTEYGFVTQARFRLNDFTFISKTPIHPPMTLPTVDGP